MMLNNCKCSLLLLSILNAADVLAGTTENWPAFKKTECKNGKGDIFIDFEEGLEGIEVAQTYPEIKFSNTNGLDWLYLDVRTGNYNANGYMGDYYAINGNKGAWLGASGNTGRIDFTGSLA
jgi:adenine-specific DNA methylase